MFFTNFQMDLGALAFCVALATMFLEMLSLSYQFTTHLRKGWRHTKAGTWINQRRSLRYSAS